MESNSGLFLASCSQEQAFHDAKPSSRVPQTLWASSPIDCMIAVVSD